MNRLTHFIITLTFGAPSVAKKVLSTKCYSAKSIHTKKTVFRPHSLLLVQQPPFKLLPFHEEKNSASSETNLKASSTDSKETISKDYWLEVIKKTVFRPNLSFLANDLR
jgi:hypothetical protein